jgi:hypothetical protein
LAILEKRQDPLRKLSLTDFRERSREVTTSRQLARNVFSVKRPEAFGKSSEQNLSLALGNDFRFP